MAKENKSGNFEMVDVDKLAECLAEQDYKAQTKGLEDRDLYEVEMIQKQGQVYVERDIHRHWSNLYWSLVENYRALIISYKKKVK